MLERRLHAPQIAPALWETIFTAMPAYHVCVGTFRPAASAHARMAVTAALDPGHAATVEA